MKRIILLLVLSLSFSSCTERYHILYDAIHYDFKSIKSYEELYQLYKKWGFWEAGTYYVQSFKYGTFWTEVFCTVDYDFLKQRLYIGFDRTQSRPISENLKNKITSTLVKKYGAYHLNEIEVARYVEGEGWVLYKDMLPCWNLKDRLLYLDLRDLDERHEFFFWTNYYISIGRNMILIVGENKKIGDTIKN